VEHMNGQSRLPLGSHLQSASMREMSQRISAFASSTQDGGTCSTSSSQPVVHVAGWGFMGSAVKHPSCIAFAIDFEQNSAQVDVDPVPVEPVTVDVVVLALEVVPVVLELPPLPPGLSSQPADAATIAAAENIEHASRVMGLFIARQATRPRARRYCKYRRPTGHGPEGDALESRARG
jgi:hypothetical protein